MSHEHFNTIGKLISEIIAPSSSAADVVMPSLLTDTARATFFERVQYFYAHLCNGLESRLAALPSESYDVEVRHLPPLLLCPTCHYSLTPTTYLQLVTFCGSSLLSPATTNLDYLYRTYSPLFCTPGHHFRPATPPRTLPLANFSHLAILYEYPHARLATTVLASVILPLIPHYYLHTCRCLSPLPTSRYSLLATYPPAATRHLPTCHIVDLC